VQRPLAGGATLEDTETVGPYLVGHLTGSLALVHLPFGEITTGVRIEDKPSAWREWWLAISAGVRIALD
jgi:hypothetical protein